MIEWKGNRDMFKDWSKTSLPVIPTNMTDIANAGIALAVQRHISPVEFRTQHISLLPTWGGLLSFSDGRYAWDLPTKMNITPGTVADPELMKDGLYDVWLHASQLKELGIDTILLPKIGAGLGRLNWDYVWDQISHWIESIATEFTVNVYSEVQRERIRIPITV